MPSPIGDTEALRAGIVSLLERMADEERHFTKRLGPSERDEDGSATRWGAKAVLAHITDFKAEQVARLEAAQTGVSPPELPARDHAADRELYAEYLSRDWRWVSTEAERTGARLEELVQVLPGNVLVTPGILPWLRGRALWAQVLVRGVWHPSAHLHQYLAERGHFDRVLGLQEGLLAAATAVGLPDAPGGRPFALYNLACAHSLRGEVTAGLGRLAEAFRLDPTLAVAAQTDPDLATVRADPQASAVLEPGSALFAEPGSVNVP